MYVEIVWWVFLETLVKPRHTKIEERERVCVCVCDMAASFFCSFLLFCVSLSLSPS